jgi:ATP-dependent exoDNAse (exonuclease V) beta subunit
MLRKNYHCINASAGSGKTFSLVQKILYLCLEKPGQPQAIQQILALTFTNKAANEMKQRLLNWLYLFSQDDVAPNRPEFESMLAYFAGQKNPINPDELVKRAKACKDYLLHHYSVFSLSTIDKFNSKLVRAFANELGLAPNFSLEINAKPYLTESVEATLSEIGQDPKLTDMFMNYLQNMRDLDIHKDLKQELIDKSSVFKEDKHYFELEKNKDFDVDHFEKSKQTLLNANKTVWQEMQNLTQQADDIIKASGLSMTDFPGKSRSIYALFQKIMGKKSLKQAIKFFESGSQDSSFLGKDPNKATETVEFLLDIKNKLYALHAEHQKNEKILLHILPLSINKMIQDNLKAIEEDKDIMLLHNFNRIIYENLKNESSGFIYEKIDAKYQHFFFDEFQDTSYMQWQNFLPLRDNCLDQEENTFTLVGDPKQSIYKFRGGDPKIMTDIINQQEAGYYHAQIQELKDNYRSSQHIIEFNNELYAYIAEGLDDNYRHIFGVSGQQNVKSSAKGRVKAQLMNFKKKSDFLENTAAKMVEDIQALVNQGFNLSDICVLCRKNHEIADLSKRLSHAKIDYQGEESYIRTYADKGLKLNISAVLNALMAFLHWVDQPSQKRHLVSMLYALQQSQRIVMADFSSELQDILGSKTHQEILAKLKQKYQLNLSLDHDHRLNLYNYVEQYLHELSVDGQESHFIVNFLEILYAYTQNNKASIKDFLNYWEEESDEFNIQISESVDAIKFMTIHSAKGLEFPVVLLPMAKEKLKFSNWLDVEDQNLEGLHSVYIEKINDGMAANNESFGQFNQENEAVENIDQICNNYVATTRPVEQLFLYLKYDQPAKSAKIGDKDNNMMLVQFAIHKGCEIPEVNEITSHEFFEVEASDLQKQKQHHRESQNVVEILHHKNQNQATAHKIKIASPSQKAEKYQDEVKLGLQVHSILEQMQTSSDMVLLLEKLLMAGEIDQKQKKHIEKRLQKLLQNPDYANYFDPKNPYLAEAEFMVELDGQIVALRPDCMVKIDDAWVILDFKTGAEDEEYELQVESYKAALEKLGWKIAKTDILYL